jgi:hypothetical protein
MQLRSIDLYQPRSAFLGKYSHTSFHVSSDANQVRLFPQDTYSFGNISSKRFGTTNGMTEIGNPPSAKKHVTFIQCDKIADLQSPAIQSQLRQSLETKGYGILRIQEVTQSSSALSSLVRQAMLGLKPLLGDSVHHLLSDPEGFNIISSNPDNKKASGNRHEGPHQDGLYLANIKELDKTSETGSNTSKARMPKFIAVGITQQALEGGESIVIPLKGLIKQFKQKHPEHYPTLFNPDMFKITNKHILESGTFTKKQWEAHYIPDKHLPILKAHNNQIYAFFRSPDKAAALTHNTQNHKAYQLFYDMVQTAIPQNRFRLKEGDILIITNTTTLHSANKALMKGERSAIRLWYSGDNGTVTKDFKHHIASKASEASSKTPPHTRFSGIIVEDKNPITYRIPTQYIQNLFQKLNALADKHQFVAPEVAGGFALSWLEALHKKESTIRVRDLDMLTWLKPNHNLSPKQAQANFNAFAEDIKTHLENSTKQPFKIVSKPPYESSYGIPRAAIVPETIEGKSQHPMLDIFTAPSKEVMKSFASFTNKHAIHFPLLENNKQQEESLLKTYHEPIQPLEKECDARTMKRPDKFIFKMATLYGKTSQHDSLKRDTAWLKDDISPFIQSSEVGREPAEALRRTLRLLFVPHSKEALNILQETELLSKRLAHTPLNDRKKAHQLIDSLKTLSDEDISESQKLQKAVTLFEEILTPKHQHLVQDALEQLQVGYKVV